MNYYWERNQAVRSFWGYLLLFMSVLTFIFGIIVFGRWTNEYSVIKECSSNFAIVFMHLHSIAYILIFVYPLAITALGLVIKLSSLLLLLKCPKLYEKLFFKRESEDV